MITVLYFARLREQLDKASEELDLPQDATISSLMTLLAARDDIWKQVFGGQQQIRAAVNLNLVKNNAAIKDGDEVAFFPPVTGG